jgi:hypothetical protein
MFQHRLTRLTAVALAAGVIAAPAASARLPAADNRGGASIEQGRDFRNPDTRGNAPAVIGQDMRSPDAVDAAAGRGTSTAPDVLVVKVKEPQLQPAADGLDWADAGIGAGVIVSLALVALGGALVLTQRRHTRTVIN